MSDKIESNHVSWKTYAKKKKKTLWKFYFHSWEHILGWIFMKFGVYVHHNNTLQKYKNWVIWGQKWCHEVKSYKYPFKPCEHTRGHIFGHEIFMKIGQNQLKHEISEQFESGSHWDKKKAMGLNNRNTYFSLLRLHF